MKPNHEAYAPRIAQPNTNIRPLHPRRARSVAADRGISPILGKLRDRFNREGVIPVPLMESEMISNSAREP
jgi:hypothetical protein